MLQLAFNKHIYSFSVAIFEEGKHKNSMPQQDHSSASLHIQHQSQHTDRLNNKACCSNCVRPLLLVIVTWMVILGSTIYIVWLVINPHNPDFRLDNISVSNITLPDSHFTASYDLEFVVNNTNKKVGLSVDHVRISVLFKDEMVSDKAFEESVYVGKMSQGKLKVHLGGDSVHKIKKSVFKDLSDAWSKKFVDFQVKIGVRIQFEYRFWPTKVRLMKVFCRDVTVEFRSTKGTGKLTSGGNCSVFNG